MIKLEDYLIPEDATDAELAEMLRSPLYRICNCYTIKDKRGQVRQFRPKPGQMLILYCLYVLGWLRILVPKARQHGVSTLSEIILLDMSLFTPDEDSRTGEPATINTPDECLVEVQVQSSIVERSRPDAEKRMQTVKTAWGNLPKEITAGTNQCDPWNKGECTWTHGSNIVAGMNARGGTNNALHVSELGVIAYNDPRRAQEIKTGALPSVPKEGMIIIESTHMGGKSGMWYDMNVEADEVSEEDKTVLDFRSVFLAWWLEKEYTLEGRVEQIDDETNTYLDGMEERLKDDEWFNFACPNGFTDGQRLWYYKTKKQQGDEMFSEYPTVKEECWMAPSPGLIYASDMDRARSEQRITDAVTYYEQLPVYTVFDLGLPINTVCWIVQPVGDQWNMLECLYGGDDCKTAAQWTKRLQAKKYMYGGHFLPHDGEVTWLNAFQEAGLQGVVCLERPKDVWQNINEALGHFSRIRFHKTSCAAGIRGLDAYHSKEENDGATVRNVPVHDWASHPSTAFGYIFQAAREGKFVDRSAMPSKPIDHRGSRTTVMSGRTAITSPRGARVTVSRNR